MTAADDPTIRATVGGVLWPGFLGRSTPDWLRRELDAGLAGVVLFAQNLAPAGGRAASAGERIDTSADGLDAPRRSTTDAGARPLLIGIDEEGGNVTRAEAHTGSNLPGAAQLGFVDDLDATEAVGRELARRSLAVGANVVLGPVADVNTDPRNPVIGVRSFGADPERVSRHVVASLRGIRSAGAAACVKHFPGHGDTHLDSHHAMPELTIGLDELERRHLPPFRAAIGAGVEAVMTAHIVVPEWGDRPSTLNPVALGRLRELGFDGVIVTDALDMAAVRESVGAGPGAVHALLAGADLLCISNPANLGAAAAPDQDERDFREVQHAIFAAIDDGTLPFATVERAARRVRRLADAVAERAAVAAASVAADDGWMPRGARRVAREAITIDGAVPALPGARTVLDLRGRSTLAVASDRDYVERTLAAGGEVLRADAPVPERGALVVLVDRIGADGAQRDRVSAVAAVRPDAVVVDVGLPGEPLPLPTLHTRAASLLAAEVASELLESGVRA